METRVGMTIQSVMFVISAIASILQTGPLCQMHAKMAFGNNVHFGSLVLCQEHKHAVEQLIALHCWYAERLQTNSLHKPKEACGGGEEFSIERNAMSNLLQKLVCPAMHLTDLSRLEMQLATWVWIFSFSS